MAGWQIVLLGGFVRVTAESLAFDSVAWVTQVDVIQWLGGLEGGRIQSLLERGRRPSSPALGHQCPGS